MGDVLDATGYEGGKDASGTGGRARERAIDRTIDAGSAPSSGNLPSTPPTKIHPAAYKPTPTEKSSRNFGAPLGSTILK